MDTILLSWLCDKVWLMFAKHTEISDRRHPAQRVHLQAVPSRTQTGMLLGDESPGVLKAQPSSLQQIQSSPSVRPLIARSLNLVIFSICPMCPIPKFPTWWCWARAAGDDPRGAAPSKALNRVLQPPPQTWVWQWCVPSGGRGGCSPPLASGCEFLVFGCLCLTPSATWALLWGSSIITYKLANSEKIFQLIWNKSDILFFTSGEIFNYNNVALSFWQMLMNCCLHVWFTA